MQSLKDSMKWDEETYGREYDHDAYQNLHVPSVPTRRMPSSPHIPW